MRLANLVGRAVIVVDGGVGIDVEAASGGAFGPDLPSVYRRWAAFREFFATSTATPDVNVDVASLEPPSPAPAQTFAIGLNYGEHAAESPFDAPEGLPPVFTKFLSSFAGAHADVALPPGGATDWEVELVVVIGEQARNVSAEAAWDYVAGVTVGQDISERTSQLAGPAPQFSLGKSFPGFTPMGPWLVTVDELDDPNNLELGCKLGDEIVQRGRTSNLIYSVPRLIEALSEVVTLLPGDIIFTGTPEGVGFGRKPQRFVQDGEVLTSWIEGVGEIEQVFFADSHQVKSFVGEN